MRKSYFLFVFLFFAIHTIVSAQSKSYLGVGTSFDFHKSIASTNDNIGLQPTDFSSIKYGIHAFWNSNVKEAFQLRVNARLNAKTIQFASEDLTAFGDLMINDIEHSFLSVDMGLTGLYAISLNENNRLLPALGVFGSYNFYNGFLISRTDGIILSAQDLLEKLPINTNRPGVAHIGLNTGLLYQTIIGGRFVEFYGMWYFSPADSFEVTFDYENIDSLTYQGHARSIVLGINVPILLKRNLYKNEE